MGQCYQAKVWSLAAALMLFALSCGDDVQQGMPGTEFGGEGEGDSAEPTPTDVAVAPDQEALDEPPAGISQREFGEEARDPFVRQFPEVPDEVLV